MPPQSPMTVPVVTTTAPAVAVGSVLKFATLKSGSRFMSNLVGLDVYNNSKQDIGDIRDVAMDENGIQAFVVSVGGFLGMGTHYILVDASSIKIAYNDAEKKLHATMNATKEQLKAAPVFTYDGRWVAGKS